MRQYDNEYAPVHSLCVDIVRLAVATKLGPITGRITPAGFADHWHSQMNFLTNCMAFLRSPLESIFQNFPLKTLLVKLKDASRLPLVSRWATQKGFELTFEIVAFPYETAPASRQIIYYLFKIVSFPYKRAQLFIGIYMGRDLPQRM